MTKLDKIGQKLDKNWTEISPNFAKKWLKGEKGKEEQTLAVIWHCLTYFFTDPDLW